MRQTANTSSRGAHESKVTGGCGTRSPIGAGALPFGVQKRNESLAPPDAKSLPLLDHASACPAGWSRGYVLVGNGWIKDGDFNSMWSKTVLPLPSRDQEYYTTPPTRLEDDPVYRRHPQDWQNYHTRYVTPRAFGDALREK